MQPCGVVRWLFVCQNLNNLKTFHTMKETYQTPILEEIEVAVEGGYAVSDPDDFGPGGW